MLPGGDAGNTRAESAVSQASAKASSPFGSKAMSAHPPRFRRLLVKGGDAIEGFCFRKAKSSP
jgi:hypothetical protein